MLGIHCRLARAGLRLTTKQIAKLTKVAPGTISRLEADENLHPRTLEAIQRALEATGIEFLFGEAPGIRIHPKPPEPKKKRKR